MSGGSGHNDWESDLSSIIEKTNQNLKLLRRIGDRRSDLGTGTTSYDTSTTAAVNANATSTRPATSSSSSAAQIASDMRSFASSISNRYAAEDAGTRHRHASTTAIPRAMTAGASTTGTRRLHRSSSVESDARERARARESLIIRPAAVVTNAFGVHSDNDRESDERSPRVRHAPAAGATTRVSASSSSGSALKRSSSLAAKTKSSTTRASTPAAPSGGPSNNHHDAVADGGTLDEVRKSLEVHIASRSSAFEKALADLRMDVTVVTTETTSLQMKLHELRDGVQTKLSNATGTATTVGVHSDSIARLEKHSAVLLGWKVGVDQDLFEISTKLKSFASVQEKITSLEGHLEALGAAIKAAHRTARHDEKIEEVKDRIAMLERQTAQQPDAKAVEHTVQMRVAKEINELENRFTQSLQFLTQKLESKLQSIEKTVQSDRIDAVASLKSELLEDVDKLESRVVKKTEFTILQNAHSQVKEDIAHMQLFFERQEKRGQELKQNSSQIREELVETRHELTKALHAQQNRVSSTLEEQVGQLTLMAKDRNTKAEQKVVGLEKRCKKIEDQCKRLHESVATVKHDALTRQAADSVNQQREAEKLRQRLVRTIAELEQLQLAKQEVERSFEAQDRQSQAKLKELNAQIDEHERLREIVRVDIVQTLQSESREMGVAQGRNALLESLLAREKQETEAKSQQILKARHEITQLRQKMRTLESEVDKKMHKLSSELQSKQTQIETLSKKLGRSEDDAQKLIEASKREKKLLTATKALKQQELALTKLKLKELEKAAATLKPAEAKTLADDLTPRLIEMEGKRTDLQLILAERLAEVEGLKTELNEMKTERQELTNKHEQTMDVEVTRLHAEYGRKIDALQQEIVTKDAELLKLQEQLTDKSELNALSDALQKARREKESLLTQLQADHARHVLESESSLHTTYSIEMETLRAQIERRVTEIAEAQQTIHEARERIAVLEEDMKRSSNEHKEEVTRLTCEMKEAAQQTECLALAMDTLKAEKDGVDIELNKMRTELEAIAVGDKELLDEADNLRFQYDELSAERERLVEGLRAKAAEVAELNQAEAQHRERIALLLNEQRDTAESVENEIELVRLTIERERDAAADSERQLQRTIENLQAELEAVKTQAGNDAMSTSKLEADMQSIKRDLEVSMESEAALKDRLDGIADALAAMGVVSLEDEDFSQVLQSHIRGLAQKHTYELAQLSATHELTLKEAAADRDRAHKLETQLVSLSSQIQDLEASNKDLQAELERQCEEYATQAQESGRLQDEISTVVGQKHALEEQVAELSSRAEELESTLHSRTEEKDTQIDELKLTNASLIQTTTEIRETMERLEQDKIVELDTLSVEIQELEAVLSSLDERPRGPTALLEKEIFANQQSIAAAGQSIRTLYAKLTSGCSVGELQELKASLVVAEATHSQVHEKFRRERQRVGEADEEVVKNVEFLDALVKVWDKNDSSFATKYVHMAPTLATRLSRLQDRFQDALQQCCSPLQMEDGEPTGSPPGPDEVNEVEDEIHSGVEDVDEDEDLESLDSSEQSGDLSVSQALDASENEASRREDNDCQERAWRESTEDEEVIEETGDPNGASGADRSGLSPRLGNALAESGTGLINSAAAAVLSTALFHSQVDRSTVRESEPVTAFGGTRADSRTAVLLERQSEPAGVVQVDRDAALDNEEETLTAKSSIRLPLEETRSGDIGDHSTGDGDGEDDESEDARLAEKHSRGYKSSLKHESNQDNDHGLRYRQGESDEECEATDDIAHDNTFETADAREDDHSEVDEVGHSDEDDDDEQEHLLSQSLKSMLLVAAGEEATYRDAPGHISAHGDDDDCLIDEESDGEGHEQHENSDISRETDEAEDEHPTLHPISDRQPLELPDEQDDFDEINSNSELEESLECSAAEENVTAQTIPSLPPPMLASRSQSAGPNPVNEDTSRMTGESTSTGHALAQVDSGESRDYEERAFEGDDEENSCDEFEQSEDLGDSSAPMNDYDDHDDSVGDAEDSRGFECDDRFENDVDNRDATSRPPSSESSPTKSNAMLSMPSLPLSRIAALRDDSDDDEFHAAQLSMDVQRRGMPTNTEDDEFDEGIDAEEHEKDQELRAGGVTTEQSSHSADHDAAVETANIRGSMEDHLDGTHDEHDRADKLDSACEAEREEEVSQSEADDDEHADLLSPSLASMVRLTAREESMDRDASGVLTDRVENEESHGEDDEDLIDEESEDRDYKQDCTSDTSRERSSLYHDEVATDVEKRLDDDDASSDNVQGQGSIQRRSVQAKSMLSHVEDNRKATPTTVDDADESEDDHTTSPRTADRRPRLLSDEQHDFDDADDSVELEESLDCSAAEEDASPLENKPSMSSQTYAVPSLPLSETPVNETHEEASSSATVFVLREQAFLDDESLGDEDDQASDLGKRKESHNVDETRAREARDQEDRFGEDDEDFSESELDQSEDATDRIDDDDGTLDDAVASHRLEHHDQRSDDDVDSLDASASLPTLDESTRANANPVFSRIAALQMDGDDDEIHGAQFSMNLQRRGRSSAEDDGFDIDQREDNTDDHAVPSRSVKVEQSCDVQDNGTVEVTVNIGDNLDAQSDGSRDEDTCAGLESDREEDGLGRDEGDHSEAEVDDHDLEDALLQSVESMARVAAHDELTDRDVARALNHRESSHGDDSDGLIDEESDDDQELDEMRDTTPEKTGHSQEVNHAFSEVGNRSDDGDAVLSRVDGVNASKDECTVPRPHSISATIIDQRPLVLHDEQDDVDDSVGNSEWDELNGDRARDSRTRHEQEEQFDHDEEENEEDPASELEQSDDLSDAAAGMDDDDDSVGDVDVGTVRGLARSRDHRSEDHHVDAIPVSTSSESLITKSNDADSIPPLLQLAALQCDSGKDERDAAQVSMDRQQRGVHRHADDDDFDGSESENLDVSRHEDDTNDGPVQTGGVRDHDLASDSEDDHTRERDEEDHSEADDEGHDSDDSESRPLASKVRLEPGEKSSDRDAFGQEFAHNEGEDALIDEDSDRDLEADDASDTSRDGAGTYHNKSRQGLSGFRNHFDEEDASFDDGDSGFDEDESDYFDEDPSHLYSAQAESSAPHVEGRLRGALDSGEKADKSLFKDTTVRPAFAQHGNDNVDADESLNASTTEDDTSLHAPNLPSISQFSLHRDSSAPGDNTHEEASTSLEALDVRSKAIVVDDLDDGDRIISGDDDDSEVDGAEADEGSECAQSADGEHATGRPAGIDFANVELTPLPFSSGSSFAITNTALSMSSSAQSHTDVAALQHDCDDDDKLHDAHLTLGLQAHGVHRTANDSAFDGNYNAANDHEETPGELRSREGVSMKDSTDEEGFDIDRDNDDDERLHASQVREVSHDHVETQKASTHASREDSHSSDRVVRRIYDHDSEEESFSEQDLDESHELEESELSSDHHSPPRALQSEGGEQVSSRLYKSDQEEPFNHTDIHADDDDDADFDRVLSASQDDDDEDEGLDQSSSFDAEASLDDTHSPDAANEKFSPALGHKHDASGERGFDEDGEDSMDEVERLLLQHAEETMSATGELTGEGGDRQFVSALRMEDDDDDELIDSESDGDEQDQDDLQGSGHSSADDEEHLNRDVRQVNLSALRAGEGGRNDEVSLAEEGLSDKDDNESDATKPPEERGVDFASGLPPSSFVATSRVGRRNFDDSDEDDDEDEVRASMAQPSSAQLPPLSGFGLGSRPRGAGGSGSLMKALQATRGATMSSEFDEEEMDEVEKLMATQRDERRPTRGTEVVLTVSTPSRGNDFDDEEQDSDHHEHATQSTSTAFSRPTDEEDGDALGDSQVDESGSEREDDDASFDDTSGTFGISFGDDDLERALEGSTKTTGQIPLAGARPRVDSESADEREEGEGAHGTPAPASSLAFASHTGSLGPIRTVGALQPLASLGRKPLPGLTALTRGQLHIDEDDDMDEVERLLLEQTSMRAAKPHAVSTASASASASASRRRHDDAEEDDEFDEQATFPSPLKDANLPKGFADDDDEFAHFDRDDKDEDESPQRRTHIEVSGSESESHASAPPSPSRIPILPGSSLLHKPLGASVTAASASLVMAARPRLASARNEDDGTDAYLEDSFDLEESLQDDEEDV